jgi:phosphoglycolate phosphatase
LFGDDWQRARDIFYAGFARDHLKLLTVLEGAEELLEAGKDLPIALVSNKNGDFLRKEAEFLNWTPRFQSIVGATDAEADKPDPAPVHLAMLPINLPLGPEIWFIGDSGTDMATARACGCTAILVQHAAANQAPIPPKLAPDLAVPALPFLTQALVELL